MFQGQVILVTGATGFIGRSLVARLRAEGATVYEHTRAAQGSIANSEALKSFSGKGVGMVYHLAARSFVPKSWETPHVFYETNVTGTATALEFCRKESARMIFLSTYVYGQPQALPIEESHPVRPANPYAHSKALAEDLCRFFSENFSVPCVVLRPFNVYGPGQSSEFLIPQMIRELKESGQVTVNDSTPRRDYLHVEDFLSACLAATRLPDKFAVSNVGSGASVSVTELVELLQDVSGIKFPWTDLKKTRPGEVSDVVCSSRLAREGLWKPRITLRDGLARLLKDS